MSVADYPHPLRRASDRPPEAVVGRRAVGLAWFFAMAVATGLAGPVFVAFFALGAFSAMGLRHIA